MTEGGIFWRAFNTTRSGGTLLYGTLLGWSHYDPGCGAVEGSGAAWLL